MLATEICAQLRKEHVQRGDEEDVPRQLSECRRLVLVRLYADHDTVSEENGAHQSCTLLTE